jgi:hypothetical protein
VKLVPQQINIVPESTNAQNTKSTPPPNSVVMVRHSVKGTCTYQLLLWSRVILDKLIVVQLIHTFPVFCARGRFITVFTTVRLWSLS